MTSEGCKPKSKETVLAVIIVVLIITATIALVFALLPRSGNEKGSSAIEDCPGSNGASKTTSVPSNGFTPTRQPSREGKYKFAGVACDNEICSRIGSDVLGRLGGSATDAAVATMFCMGVLNMMYNGLGGGAIITLYDTPRGDSQKIVTTIFAREVAPAAATQDMFVNKTGASRFGGLAVGVPGQLAGLYTAWQKFGKVPWQQLVSPSIEICRDGFQMYGHMAFVIAYYEEKIRAEPTLAELFVKSDGSLVVEGDVITLPLMANTLQRVAADPMDFYTGSLANEIAQDLADHGSIITAQDLANYATKEKSPQSVQLQNGNFTVYSPKPPSSGAVLQYILNILDAYQMSPDSVDPASRGETYHRVIEAFKFAFGQRSALGDEDFVNVTEILDNLRSDTYAQNTMRQINDTHTQELMFYGPKFDLVEDHGTTHVSVMAPDGSAVSITGTINLGFGALIRGRRTGIIFNDEMDDFSTPDTVNFFGVPASPSNYIEPGKMPMSSMSPTLVLDQQGNVVLVIGASGGTRIITSIALVIARTLWLGHDLKEAVDQARLHHQLLPNTILVEDHIDENLLSALKSYGHETTDNGRVVSMIHAIRSTCSACQNVTCLGRACIHAVSDILKEGVPNGY